MSTSSDWTIARRPTQAVEGSIRQLIGDVKEFARRQPVQAVGTAFGLGLLINLLPTRVVAGTASAVGATLLRPALLSLGIIKAVELCCRKPNPQTQPT